MALERAETSCCWKFWQVTFYLVAFVGGVIASVTLAVTVRNFDGRCPLYTELKQCSVETSNVTQNSLVVGADQVEVWQMNSECDFSTFVPMSGATVAFILAYFVLMFDTAHKVSQKRSSHNRMIGLFFPLLLTSLVLTILMLTSAVRTLRGTEIFCSVIFDSLSFSCQQVQFYEWEGFPLVRGFYSFLLTSVITSWIATSAYILSIVLLFIRCGCEVDYVSDSLKKSLPQEEKMTEPKKAPLRKKGHHRQDSMQQPLLQSDMSTSESPSLVTRDEPEPGPSRLVPELVIHPSSDSSPPGTVAL